METHAALLATTTFPESSRSKAAREHKRPDERVRYDQGDCDEQAKNSQKCLESVGYDRNRAGSVCKPHYEAYRECRKAVTDLKRKAANTTW